MKEKNVLDVLVDYVFNEKKDFAFWAVVRVTYIKLQKAKKTAAEVIFYPRPLLVRSRCLRSDDHGGPRGEFRGERAAGGDEDDKEEVAVAGPEGSKLRATERGSL